MEPIKVWKQTVSEIAIELKLGGKKVKIEFRGVGYAATSPDKKEIKVFGLTAKSEIQITYLTRQGQTEMRKKWMSLALHSQEIKVGYAKILVIPQ